MVSSLVNQTVANCSCWLNYGDLLVLHEERDGRIAPSGWNLSLFNQSFSPFVPLKKKKQGWGKCNVGFFLIVRYFSLLYLGGVEESSQFCYVFRLAFREFRLLQHTWQPGTFSRGIPPKLSFSACEYYLLHNLARDLASYLIELSGKMPEKNSGCPQIFLLTHTNAVFMKTYNIS